MRNVVACAALAAMAVSGCKSGGHYGTVAASGGGSDTSTEPVACTELINRTGIARQAANAVNRSTPSSEQAADGTDGRDWLTLGSTSASRALVARMLRDMSSSEPVSEATANLAVRCLSALYGLRVQRQQIWMDSGARVSFLAALGSALTKGTTQNSWAGIAIFPAMLGQAEAFHPTRSLFSSAEASLEALVARYAMAQDVMDQAATIQTLPEKSALQTLCVPTNLQANIGLLPEAAQAEVRTARAAALRDCQGALGRIIAARVILDRIAPRPGIAGQPAVPHQEPQLPVQARDAVQVTLPDGTVTTIPPLAAQTGVREQQAQVEVKPTQARSSGNVLLTRRLLCDALYIDTQVVQRDQQMRTTPEMAAGRLLTSPLRALDSIFTKSESISPERLRATLALEDFEVRYTGLPELKSIADSLALEDDGGLTARIAALARATQQPPSGDDLEGIDGATRAAVERSRQEHAANVALLAALREVQAFREGYARHASNAQAAIAGLNAAFAHFGNLATPTGVRFKYNVGEQRFNLEPLPQEPTATVSLMQTHCR